MTKHVKAYWWKAVENFGDALSPLLLYRFAYLENLQWSNIQNADIASIGSILEHIPPGWKGRIVGSGLLRETSRLKFNPEEVKVLALRGPLSAKLFPSGSFALGDPGLLASELIPPQDKQWDLGILPHWQDEELADRFLNTIPSKFSCRVISPSSDPVTVLKEISASRRLVTSSLHGVICADAFCVPRRIEICDKMAADGGTFKFRDYHLSIQCEFEIGKMTEPLQNRVDDARFEIYDAYRELGIQYEHF